MTRYALDPARPVLLRPDDTVQVGWDPRRAVLVRPPTGLTAAALAELLRELQTGAALADVQADAARRGADDDVAVAALVTALIDAGVVSPVDSRRLRAVSIRIHGRGPLSDLIAGALRCSGAVVRQSSQRHAGVTSEAPDLVILSDYLVTDPRVLRELHDAGVPHLSVRVRDGVGLIGPLVVPGQSSCLRCGDLHRADRDAAWPAVAAQLLNTVGNADRATVLATAALALNQVDQVVRAVHGGGTGFDPADPPVTLDTTLEFDISTGSIVTRRWSRHPQCEC